MIMRFFQDMSSLNPTAGSILRKSFSSLMMILALSQGGVFASTVTQEMPESKIPSQLRDIQIKENLGGMVSLSSLTFKDESGASVRLSDYFKRGKPVLLTLVYYECPNLCNFMLNGLVQSLKTLDWTPGNQFEIVSVSINPREKSDLASRKKDAYLKAYNRPEARTGWHFLTGEEDQIQKLAKEVGFGYRYDEQEKQYAHGAVIFALTPEGKISRYLYGIEYPNKDLRLALLEASNGKIGTVVDRFLLFCYRYDPQTRRYSIYLTKLMQAACGATVVIFGGYLLIFWRRQRKGAYSNV
jgi:protein SCO1/2